MLAVHKGDMNDHTLQNYLIYLHNERLLDVHVTIEAVIPENVPQNNQSAQPAVHKKAQLTLRSCGCRRTLWVQKS